MNETIGTGSDVQTPQVPAQLHLDELYAEPLHELVARAYTLRMRVNPERSRRHLIFDLLRCCAERGTVIHAEGILELSSFEGYGFLRRPRFNYRPGPEDAYVSLAQFRKAALRAGQRIAGRIRAPRDREKYITLDEITAIEGRPVETWVEPKDFDKLTPT